MSRLESSPRSHRGDALHEIEHSLGKGIRKGERAYGERDIDFVRYREQAYVVLYEFLLDC
jgi:hypothetical protein